MQYADVLNTYDGIEIIEINLLLNVTSKASIHDSFHFGNSRVFRQVTDLPYILSIYSNFGSSYTKLCSST